MSEPFMPPICAQTMRDLNINPFTPIECYRAYGDLAFLPIYINFDPVHWLGTVPEAPWVIYREEARLVTARDIARLSGAEHEEALYSGPTWTIGELFDLYELFWERRHPCGSCCTS